MKREDFKKAKLTIERINQCTLQIVDVRDAIKNYIHLQMGVDGEYKPIPVTQKRAKEFLEIVKQDLVTEKAKLEKELEDL